MLARIEAGDEYALGAVYDQYSALVYGMARRLVGDGDAVDICQEVFLALWEHPERFDADRGRLRSYLAVMARRRAIDLLRSSNRRRDREDRASSVPSVASVPDVDEAAVALVAADRIQEALDALPEAQREAIELAYFGGHTFVEVAEVMGTSEGTAKSRLRLGLRRLSGELSGWGNEEVLS